MRRRIDLVGIVLVLVHFATITAAGYLLGDDAMPPIVVVTLLTLLAHAQVRRDQAEEEVAGDELD